MAPSTNTGAAHRVSSSEMMDPVGNKKATNEALACIRTIARKGNPYLAWAEEAVRNGVSILCAPARGEGRLYLS